ncbi:MAG: hypothetical protein ACFCUE_06775 [Candidatus Bathyarchaeia archaeon]
MQAQLASLLLIVSTVALASVVIGFAVAVTEQTLSPTDNPIVDDIKDIQNRLNDTCTWLDNMQSQMLNETMPTSEP